MCIVTNHGEERIKNRLGLSKKLSEKVSDKALENGLKHSDCKGRLRKFLDKLYLSHGNANNMRVYNRKVFLFHDNVLITIIDLPYNFYNAVDKIKNRKEK